MENRVLSIEERERIVKYCGNDQCILIGWITELKKNKFYARFDRKEQESLELEQKKKKLNLKQKTKLVEGQIIKLDFNDGKLYFKDGENNWI